MAKAKRLNTTVHVGDSETGETRVLGPNDKLSAADRKELESRWGKRSAEFFEDTEDDEPEEMDPEAALEAGHPHHDTALPVQDKGGAPGVRGAQKINQETREADAKRAAAAREGKSE
jgi:hypothetical protein